MLNYSPHRKLGLQLKRADDRPALEPYLARHFMCNMAGWVPGTLDGQDRWQHGLPDPAPCSSGVTQREAAGGSEAEQGPGAVQAC